MATNLLTLLIGLLVGAKFADIDLAPPLYLRHRSAWTHSPLPVLALVWAFPLSPYVAWFAMGFTLMHAIHLGKDMFPRRWVGRARVNIYPLNYIMPGWLSFVFLGYSAWVSARQFVALVERLF